MQEKLKQLLKMLDDPEISETVKETVRASIRELNTGGFKAALEKNSIYLARNDLDVFAEIVFGVVPAVHHREMTRVLMDDSLKNVLIVACPGAAKCQKADSRVQKEDGTLKELQYLQPGERILSLNLETLKQEWKPVLWKEKTGQKECFKVRTRSGLFVEITADHRMYTFDGWKECRDLEVGNFIPTPLHLSEPTNPIKIPEDHRKLLALWISEGCRSKNLGAVILSNSDPKILEELKVIAKNYGGNSSYVIRDNKNVGIRLNKGGAAEHPREILLKYGLDPRTCGAHEKFVPEDIFKLSNKDLALFLNRLFTCDGTLGSVKKRSGEKSAVISYCTVSRRLIEDIKTLLLRFNIIGRIRKCYNTDGTDSGKVFESWKLDIAEGAHVHTFMREIGMLTKGHRFTEDLKKTTSRVRRVGKADQIPSSWRRELRGVPIVNSSRYSQLSKTGATSRSRVQEIASITELPVLHKLSNSEIIWDEVVSIEPVGIHETYDIEVEDNHNFFANGLLSHNSTYVSQIFPAWYMGKHPNRAIQLISSSSTQSSKLSSSVRLVVGTNPMYKKVFPELEPDDADGGMGWTRDMLYIKNRTPGNKDPNLLAAGVDSTTVLGSRADLTIVDDPTTQQQASSPGELAKQKEWFRDTLLTRLRPGGRVVVVLTRWNENDLASMLVRDLGFTVVHMPAMGEDEGGAYVDYIPGMRIDSAKGWDPDNLPINVINELEEYRTKAIEGGFRAEITKSAAYNRPCVRKYLHADKNMAQWPGEHNLEALEYYKEVRLGPIRFRLVYQGDPTGVTGDIFKREWFRYYGDGQEKTRIPEDVTYFQSVDVATSTAARSDYFVIATVALDSEGNYYIVDIVRKKLMAPEQRELVKQNYLRYPKTVWVLIETVAYQLALFQELSKMNVPCRTYRPRNKKKDRAISASAVFSAKRVYLPVEAEWLNDFRDEFTSFPRGRHDDQIDTISSLFEELATNWNPFPAAMDVGFGSEEDDDIDIDVYF